jgi:transcriptional regulator GlxA family with amidase domain
MLSGKGLGRVPAEQWRVLGGASRYDANELARRLCISTRQLQRVFRLQFDRSPQDWLNEQRILRARELLLSGSHSVKEVALDLGFKQVSHFCRQFKLRNHLTPSEFATGNFLAVDVADR